MKLGKWVHGPILTLDGTEVIPSGVINLNLKISNRSFKHEFAVMPCSHPLLLGMDFLHKCGLLFDMKDLLWGFSDTWPVESHPLKVVMSNNTVTHTLTLLEDSQRDDIKDLLSKFPDVIDAPRIGRIKGVEHNNK